MKQRRLLAALIVVTCTIVLMVWQAQTTLGVALPRGYGASGIDDYPPGSVLLMHLDEPAGSTTFGDSSGNANHGSCTGGSCPTAGVAGHSGTALSFDGANDYLTVPASGVSLANKSFTVAAWARRASASQWHVIFGQGSIGTNHGFNLSFGPTRGFVCAFYDNDLDAPGYNGTDGWHHWACTFDLATRQRRTYRDGELIAQDLATAAFQGSGSFYIGRMSWGDYFSGEIDEVSVFYRALPQAEIQDLMFAGGSSTPTVTLTPTATPTPTGLWVTQTEPGPNAVHVSRTTPISVTFSEPIDAGTVGSDTFVVWGQLTGRRAGNYSVLGNTVQFEAHDSFLPGEEIVVSLGSGLQSASGDPLLPRVWSFRVQALGTTAVFGDSGQSLGSWPSRAALGDLDGDGDLDAFIANHGVLDVADTVWFNDGAGHLIDSGQRLGTTPSGCAALGDLDGDGDLDAFVTNDTDGIPDRIWLNDGTGYFSDSGQLLGDTGSQTVALGDLDGDGDLDAFIGNFWNQGDSVWLNDGTGVFSDSGQSLGAYRTRGVALGDVDGDGDLDAFTVSSDRQPDKIWLNNGSGVFVDSGQNLANDYGITGALGDLDGDGDLDAFVANEYANTVWLNDGAGRFVNNGQALGNENTWAVALGDLDGDGDLDAFVGNAGQGNQVWLNDGLGQFSSNGQSLGNDNSVSVSLGDLDGDSDLDALVGNWWGDQPDRVWFNQGSVPTPTPSGTPPTPTPTATPRPIPTGPVLLMHFEEPSRSLIFQDSSGNGYDGVCFEPGCPTAGVAGQWDAAVDLDGVDDYVVVSAGSVNLANSSFTVAAWTNRASPEGWSVIAGQGSIGTNQGFHMGFGPGRGFMCAFYDNDLDAPGNDGLGWHHWACTFDVTTRQRRIYRDGQVIAEDTASAAFQGTGSLYIGRMSWGDYFQGKIDELTIYNRALSPAEVQMLAVPGAGSTPTPTPTATPTSSLTPATPTFTPTPTATPTSTPISGSLWAAPEYVDVSLPQAYATVVSVSVGNAGNQPLDFSISRQSASTAGGAAKTWQAIRFPANKVAPDLADAFAAAPDGRADFIAYLAEQADLSGAYTISDWEKRGQYVLDRLLETAQGSQPAVVNKLRGQQAQGHVQEVRSFFVVNALLVTGDQAAMATLAAESAVAYIAPAPTVFILPASEEKPASAPVTVPWNLALIGADQVWNNLGHTGAGVVIGEIDTGVDHDHPALIDQYRGTSSGSHDFNWYDATGASPATPEDLLGHGTHVMGVMVGDEGAGSPVGVAPGAQWMAARGCASTTCEAAALLQAAQWMLAPCPVGVEPGSASCSAGQRPHIINNSWGSGGGDLWFQASVEAWRAAGIFPVFSAGNSGPDNGTLSSPGDYSASIAVGATDGVDQVAGFSSRGPSTLTTAPKPDLTAPGFAITSAAPGGGYVESSGTSTASPHVAGAAALLLSANPDLDLADLAYLLTSTSVDLGAAGPDYSYGYGRLNVYAASQLVGDPVPWLAVQPDSGTLQPNSTMPISVTVDSTGLPPGPYRVQMLVNDNTPGGGSVPILLNLGVEASLPQVARVEVGSVGATSARIGWITNAEVSGQIRFGLSPDSLTEIAQDLRGSTVRDDTHLAVLAGLTPETTYYFQVLSDGAVYDDGGQPFSFTTGRLLSPPQPDGIYGQLFKPDGVTPADDALVQMRLINNDSNGSIGESAHLLALTGSGGWFSFNLGDSRLGHGLSYFSYSASGDNVRIDIDAGGDCRTATQLDTGNDSPMQPLILACQSPMLMEVGRGLALFTWPQAPRQTVTAEELLDDVVAQGGAVRGIYEWYELEKTWRYHPINTPFQNFVVAADRPYLLYSDRRSLFQEQAGLSITHPDVIQLTVGLNFVTLANPQAGLRATEACSQIAAQGGHATEIYRWQDKTGGWEVHICGYAFGDFQLAASDGFFVKSEANSTWRPQPGSATTTRVLRPTSSFDPTVSPVIANVLISDVTDKSFVVSWTTDVPSPAEIHIGPSAALGNITVETDSNGYAHRVTVTDLMRGTNYLFDVVSGSSTANNGGAHFSRQTGPVIEDLSIDPVFGRIVKEDGVTPVVGALVYVTLVDGDNTGSLGASLALSTRTNHNGYWSVNLTGARTADASADFDYTHEGGDRIHVQVQAGPDGTTGMSFDVSATNDASGNAIPLPNMAIVPTSIAEIQRTAALLNLARVDAGFDPYHDMNADGLIDIRDVVLAAEQWR